MHCSQKFTMLREHRTFIVRVYFQNNLYLSVQRWFEEEFLDVLVPNKSTIKWLVDEFNTTGCVDDLLHLGKLNTATIATEQDKVRTLVEENLQTPTLHLVTQRQLACWVCVLTKKPRHISVVQKLLPPFPRKITVPVKKEVILSTYFSLSM